MEDFYTIQGEGAFQGHAAYFIRLAGCDVGCTWCDVKASWDANAHPVVAVADIVGRAKHYGGKIAVVTGGEPTLYDLTGLTAKLGEAGMRTHLETSGAHEITGRWDWVCLSPKKFKKPVRSSFRLASELKIIVYNKSDFAWAEEHASHVPEACLLYLQPEWSKEKEMVPHIVDYVKSHPRWRISLQAHKYMDIP
ncbi:MAG TPA: 7-carboxy-7-deazaguanine synthase QueE [Cyclobacteriaceae bacterium]|nr:radical SAM protein [Cyclobacteriaceae bacterium]MCB9238406.1 radical SAM protein [Flammeovirgaceae bacterium]MCB0500909.1 radical SAM protein [Cyclobacteriaceae bacterium]MCO5272087.1 7-carboxy-7-deazaguanine synthase QueE [Cyclobacteriaceae bacterium]MCW5903889.1 radical SAM protein [Cyclobacteriaceae bacterium]